MSSRRPKGKSQKVPIPEKEKMKTNEPNLDLNAVFELTQDPEQASIATSGDNKDEPMGNISDLKNFIVETMKQETNRAVKEITKTIGKKVDKALIDFVAVVSENPAKISIDKSINESGEFQFPIRDNDSFDLFMLKLEQEESYKQYLNHFVARMNFVIKSGVNNINRIMTALARYIALKPIRAAYNQSGMDRGGNKSSTTQETSAGTSKSGSVKNKVNKKFIDLIKACAMTNELTKSQVKSTVKSFWDNWVKAGDLSDDTPLIKTEKSEDKKRKCESDPENDVKRAKIDNTTKVSQKDDDYTDDD